MNPPSATVRGRRGWRNMEVRTRSFLRALVLTVAMALFAGTAGTAQAAFTKVSDLSYDGTTPTSPLKEIDLYLPEGAAPGDLRPVVIYVHGGGWMIGDKSNKMADKPRLFADAGYIFASVNYRLSPDITSGPLPPAYPAGRVMFPDHPRDVGESIAWLARNIDGYGGDPDALVLMGHSAGAHLVSLVGSDPAYLEAFGASLEQVAGVVSLDAGAVDVADSAAQRTAQPVENDYVIWNAFGTPAEEAGSPRWVQASPTTWGDPTDPRSLMITQSARPARIIDNQKMAAALGQDTSSILTVPLNHEEINEELGSPTDSTGETAAVMSFIADRAAARTDPALRIKKRPAKVVKIGRRKKKRQVVFAFTASGTDRVECRIDRGTYRPCASPRRFTVKRGKHTFRVRALYPSGRTGAEKTVSFRIKSKARKINRRG